MPVPLSPYLIEPADIWYHLQHSIQLGLQQEGDLAECGVAEGHSAREILRMMREANVVNGSRRLHLFDTFRGVPNGTPMPEDQCEHFYPRGNAHDPKHRNFAVGVPAVRHFLRDHEASYQLHPGPFDETMPEFTTPLCWMFVDCNWKRSVVECFRLADRCLVKHGVMVVHDVGHSRHRGVSVALETELDWKRYWIIQPRKQPETADAGLAVVVKLQ